MRLSSFPFAAAIILSFSPAVHADVTIRYENTFKFALGMPGMPKDAAALFPTAQAITIHLKGNKGYSNSGARTAFLEDFSKQEITLVDAENKKFAIVPMQDYLNQLASAMPKMPEGATAAMESMKFDVSSKSTGKTSVIQGVQAEETEITLTMAMPLPAGMPGMEALPPGPMIRFVMQLWTAKPDEAFHNDAIRQLVGHNMYASQLMNPAAGLQKLFAALPGMGASMQKLQQQFSGGGSVVLRSHGEMFMPMMAMMAKLMNKDAQGAAMEPNAPLMEMNSEVTELSTAGLSDSIFQVPATYAPAKMEELMQPLLVKPLVVIDKQ